MELQDAYVSAAGKPPLKQFLHGAVCGDGRNIVAGAEGHLGGVEVLVFYHSGIIRNGAQQPEPVKQRLRVFADVGGDGFLINEGEEGVFLQGEGKGQVPRLFAHLIFGNVSGHMQLPEFSAKGPGVLPARWKRRLHPGQERFPLLFLHSLHRQQKAAAKSDAGVAVFLVQAEAVPNLVVGVGVLFATPGLIQKLPPVAGDPAEDCLAFAFQHVGLMVGQIV